MADPLVCCVMLTKDRPAMAKRAVECFRAQTYQNKRLYVYDTGARPCVDSLPDEFPEHHIVYHRGLDEGLTIGELRNRANWWGIRQHATALPDADIIVHFDDDDLSHPNRIQEQVALLQASGKQAVGYRDMLFWKDGDAIRGPHLEVLRSAGERDSQPLQTGEAWLYHNDDPRYIVGSSLCYWRETWEKRPFKDLPVNRDSLGEDTEFIRDRDTLGISSFDEPVEPGGWLDIMTKPIMRPRLSQPRMICSIHGANSTNYGGIEKSGNWKRVPEWDQHCRATMAL